MEPLLSMRGLDKRYPGVHALNNIDLDVYEHTVLGMVGENGAGKSTILNVLSGVIQPDAGEVLLMGRPHKPSNYHESMLAGVSRVFQEQALVPNLRVCENMFLTHENRFRSGGAFLNFRKMADLAARELASLGLDIDPMAQTDSFDTSTRQVIEIARAICNASLLGIENPLVLLDEPTAALTGEEVENFFGMVRQLQARATFIFVSHRLPEILQLSDRVVVLKDGSLVANLPRADVTEPSLHALMVGRERDADYYHEDRQRGSFGDEVLAVENLGLRGQFSDVTLSVRQGEVLGVGGVLGSGKSELGRSMAMILPHTSGTISLQGKAMTRGSLKSAMAEGLGYLPQERHTEGVILGLGVDKNMTLANLRESFEGRLFLRMKQEKKAAESYVKALNVKTPSIKTLTMALSGGNQQKVVLAKWLMREPKVLILDNPTSGIDAGAKEEIYTLLRGLTDQGMAIILISDDLLELIGLSDRILVMKDGRITREETTPRHEKPQEKDLIAFMV